MEPNDTTSSPSQPEPPGTPAQPDAAEPSGAATPSDAAALPDAPAQRDRFDTPWKDAVELAFPEFLAFYFPEAHRQIDWTRECAFLNTELTRLLPSADSSDRHADKLVQVHLKRGGERCVYVHVEVQAGHDTDFALRMYTASYRIFDRFGLPVASLAVLADDRRGWRPDHFELDALGSRVRLDFLMVKLLDRAGDLDALLADPNPFALVTAAHLLTRATRGRNQARLQAKRRLVLLLFERDWDQERVNGFIEVLDWMMKLPPALEPQLWQDIKEFEGSRDMRYISSIERISLQKGREAQLLEQLIHRFGPLPESVISRVESGSVADLARWALRILDARELADVFASDS